MTDTISDVDIAQTQAAIDGKKVQIIQITESVTDLTVRTSLIADLNSQIAALEALLPHPPKPVPCTTCNVAVVCPDCGNPVNDKGTHLTPVDGKVNVYPVGHPKDPRGD